MGLASYYRRFIESFAKIASPLHALTRKDVPFRWTDQCQAALNQLRQKLTDAPVLSYPQFDRGFVLETDASVQGLGAVLLQIQEDQQLHPVAYASRALSPCEKNYGITDLETLAVVWALSHFKVYVYGQEVKVITDHTAVKSVLLNPDASGKHARWWAKVFESGLGNITICYRKGSENAPADALSRAPCQGEAVSLNEELEFAVFQVEGEITPLLVAGAPMTDAVVTDIGREQRKDPKLLEMISYLESGDLPEEDKRAREIVIRAEQFTILNDILHLVDAKRRQPERS